MTDQQVLKKPVAEISQTQCAHLTSVTVTVVLLECIIALSRRLPVRQNLNKLFMIFIGNYFSIDMAYVFVTTVCIYNLEIKYCTDDCTTKT